MNKLNNLIFSIILTAVSNVAFSNDLQITNIAMLNDSTITFDVQWSNSWKVSVAPNNQDAVWIFVKKRDCASLNWSHVDLSPIVGNHTAASPLEVYIDGKDGSSSAKGVFLRRTADGTGNISATSIALRMKGLPAGSFDFKVFGIEMVQIPQGSFYLGDGQSTVAEQQFRTGPTSDPFFVTSENAITAGSLVNQITTISTTNSSIPLAFPKGFNEFYCMKYEISQGQYVDFLNCLNSAQVFQRTNIQTISRYSITGSWPVLQTPFPYRAMSFLSWTDMLAYLDWSALRPMTELEFEKACRGPVYPVLNEYAWGTGNVQATSGQTIATDGTASEGFPATTVPPGSGFSHINCSTPGLQGPLRSGFAAKAGTNRREAGASYYGVMELTGNVREQVVSTYLSVGVLFQGTLGDGEVSSGATPGFADVSTWPSAQAPASAVSATGKMTRGGSYIDAPGAGEVSSRMYYNIADNTRLQHVGGRGVR